MDCSVSPLPRVFTTRYLPELLDMIWTLIVPFLFLFFLINTSQKYLTAPNFKSQLNSNKGYRRILVCVLKTGAIYFCIRRIFLVQPVNSFSLDNIFPVYLRLGFSGKYNIFSILKIQAHNDYPVYFPCFLRLFFEDFFNADFSIFLKTREGWNREKLICPQ